MGLIVFRVIGQTGGHDDGKLAQRRKAGRVMDVAWGLCSGWRSSALIGLVRC